MIRFDLGRTLKVILCLTILVLLTFPNSCKKENVQPLKLLSIKAGGIDLLNAPVEVPVATAVVVTFTTGIDPASVTPTSVIMTRDYDHSAVVLNLIVAGNTLSVKSTGNLISGAFYTMTISNELKSIHGEAFGSITSTFKTAGRFVPDGEVAYWNFNETASDLIGTYDPAGDSGIDILYGPARNDSAFQAAQFNGTTSIIEVANGISLLKPHFSISFWVFVNNDNHFNDKGQVKRNFVFGIGNTHGLSFVVDPDFTIHIWQGLQLADLTTASNDFEFSANGITKDNVTGGGIDNATVVNQNFGLAGIRSKLNKVWAHVLFTFADSTKTRTLYINGEKMIEQDLGLLANDNVDSLLRPLGTVVSPTFIQDTASPIRYDDKLSFGFWQNSAAAFGKDSAVYTNRYADHFQGSLDDVRFFNRALSETEVELIYDGEK